jgi:uncharacterized protein (DUF2141 family)
MKKIIVSLTLATLFLACIAFAERKFTISGVVEISEEADLIVCLFNQQTWPSWKKASPQLPFTQILKADRSGKRSFVFKQVPRGEYIIFAFADTNGNGKLDCDAEGWMQEPISSHKPPLSGAAPSLNWYDQKFMVDKDIDGIAMEMY